MSYITLNKKNFFHNLEICSQQAKGKDKIAIVLKDNAYGHGLIEIATMASEFGLTKAVVQTLEEAKKIKHFFEQILILADCKNSTFSHNFHITINNLEDLENLCENTDIHIKIDTGMHRNGISPNELEVAIYSALEKKLNICGIFTHYKSADCLSSEFFWQKSVFKGVLEEMKTICEKLNLSHFQVHSANSSALFREQNFNEDFARIGIAAYGYIESDPALCLPNLKPILSLYANKLSTRNLQKGQSVGYGGKYTADETIQISTYDIGYGDGFKRIPDNSSYKTPNNEDILGRVSMDNISVKSTKDEICLFNDVTSLSKLHNTISYEILTSLNSNIQRIIV